MQKQKKLNKKEIVQVTLKLFNAFSHLLVDYQRAIHFNYDDIKIGEWGLEQSFLGQTTIESILKITNIESKTSSYEGIDLLGEKRAWRNARFIPLPRSTQDYLNGKYKW